MEEDKKTQTTESSQPGTGAGEPAGAGQQPQVGSEKVSPDQVASEKASETPAKAIGGGSSGAGKAVADETGAAKASATKAAHGGGAKGKPPVAGRDGGKKRGRRLLVFLVLLALVIGGGVYGWSRYGDLIASRLEPWIPVRDSGPTIAPAAPVTEPAQRPEPPAAPSEAPSEAAPVAPALPSPPDPELLNLIGEVQLTAQQQQAALETLEDQVARLQVTLNGQQERLRALSTTTREDWLLAEAQYLLRLANQRILTERDGANALALMESADRILRELDDPDLYPVRRALAEDITAVRVASVIDREGLYLELNALVGLVPELKISALDENRPQQQTDSQPDVAIPWYRTLAANAWQALEKLSGIVRVERVGNLPDTVLLPSEQQLLRENLRLALEQAQLALLREEQAIYGASLARAVALLEDNFEAEPPAAEMADRLRTLAEERVSAGLPPVTGSIAALRDYASLWHNRYRVDSPPEASQTPAQQPAETDTREQPELREEPESGEDPEFQVEPDSQGGPGGETGSGGDPQ